MRWKPPTGGLLNCILQLSQREETAQCTDFQFTYDTAVALERKKQELTIELASISSAIASHKQAISDAEVLCAVCENDFSTIVSEEDRLKTQLCEEENDLPRLQAEVLRLETEVAEAETGLLHIDKINSCVEEKCTGLQREVLSLTSKLSKINAASLSASAKKSKFKF